MKIAFATESFPPRVDEVADTARHIADGLLDAGHEVLVLTPGPGQASYRGARILRARRLMAAVAVPDAIDRFDPALIIGLNPGVLGSAALRHGYRLGLPTLAIDPPALHARAARTLATSRDRQAQLAALGVSADLWTPGVDLDEHHPGLRDERLRSAWTRSGRMVVGHVGEVGKEKVIDRLTRIALIRDVRLVVFGDGPGARELRAAGATVTGAASGLELARGIASLDVLVQPRKKEQQVPGVRRALASGVPVVGFDAGGTRDVVVDRHNGLLADPEHNRDLRRAIKDLQDTELRERLAGHARGSVADRPWTKAVAELSERHLPALT